jgi:hypothetical protein
VRPHRTAPQRCSPTASAGARSAPPGSTARSQGHHSSSLWCPPKSPFCDRRCGFTCVRRRSMGTTRPTSASPPTSSSCAASTRTERRPGRNSRSSAPPRSPPAGQRTPLRSSYEATVPILILRGLPERAGGERRDRSTDALGEGDALSAVRRRRVDLGADVVLRSSGALPAGRALGRQDDRTIRAG